MNSLVEAVDSTADLAPLDPLRAATKRKYETWERLEAQITELWAYLNVATCRFLTLVAEFDREQGYQRHGLVSTAQWLNWWCGIGKGAAREKVRVARALEHLPRISAGFEAGELSYSKVREMTRVATPANEHVLLNVARYGTATHVEKLVKKYRWTQERDAARASNAAHLSRYLHYYTDDEHNLHLQGKLPAEIGALVAKALQVAGDVLRESADQSPRQPNAAHDVAAGTWAMREREESYAARRADALQLVAETFLACRSEELENVSSGDRYQIVVHVDQAVLAQAVRPPETEPHRAELEAGPALALGTIRRLACDAALVAMVDGEDGEPLSVGRKTRAIPAAIERALRARDGGCRFPGCDRTRFTQGHHVEHWTDGGETNLSNLLSLCSFHHRLVHEGGFGVRRMDDGLFVFTRPDGARIPECRPPPTPACTFDGRSSGSAGADGRSSGNAASDGTSSGNAAPESPEQTAPADPSRDRALERYVQRAYPDLVITPRTAACKWTGERMDYSMAIESMQWHEQHYRGPNHGEPHCDAAALDTS